VAPECRNLICDEYISGGKLLSAYPDFNFKSKLMQIKINKIVNDYSAVTTLLSAHHKQLERSAFFSSPYSIDDCAFSIDAYEKINHKDPLYFIAWKMLFHWRAWELVQNGKIYDLLRKPNDFGGHS
jgi:hypothetical protein